MDPETKKFLEDFRAEVNARFDGIEGQIGVVRDRLTVASEDRRQMLEILKILKNQKSGGRPNGGVAVGLDARDG